MVLNKTKFTLFICCLIPIVLHLSTSHIGDLKYYVSIDDNSFRSKIGSSVYLALWKISGNYTFVIVAWSVIQFLITIKTIKKLDNAMKLLMILISPFLFFPSKESSIFSISLLMILFLRHRYIRRTLIWTVLALVRPMLLALILAKNMKFYSLIILINIALFFSVNIDIINHSFESLVQLTLRYSIGYFQTAVTASSTDFQFLDSLKSMETHQYLIEGITRFAFPVWMLDLNLTSKAYFLIYIFIFINVARLINKGTTLSSFVIAYSKGVILLIPFMPVCIVNAGSGVRYLSAAVILIFVINENRKRDFVTLVRA